MFWSKLLKRLEPSEQEFLDQCRRMSLLSKTVCHILFLIKAVQSEVGEKSADMWITLPNQYYPLLLSEENLADPHLAEVISVQFKIYVITEMFLPDFLLYLHGS